MVISKNYHHKTWFDKLENKNSHLRIMIDFLKKKKNPLILELGVERGASTTAFLSVCEEIDGTLYSVDIDDCKDVVISDKWNFLQSNDLDFKYILEKFKKLEVEGIDLLYIDSYHEKKHVLGLLNIWFKYVKKNGAIFIDDVDSLPFLKKKDIWTSIVYDNIDEGLREFFMQNDEKIFYTKYFGENGLAKFEKLSNFLDTTNHNKKIWKYNPLIKFFYPFLRSVKKNFKI